MTDIPQDRPNLCPACGRPSGRRLDGYCPGCSSYLFGSGNYQGPANMFVWNFAWEGDRWQLKHKGARRAGEGLPGTSKPRPEPWSPPPPAKLGSRLTLVVAGLVLSWLAFAAMQSVNVDKLTDPGLWALIWLVGFPMLAAARIGPTGLAIGFLAGLAFWCIGGLVWLVFTADDCDLYGNPDYVAEECV